MVNFRWLLIKTKVIKIPDIFITYTFYITLCVDSSMIKLHEILTASSKIINSMFLKLSTIIKLTKACKKLYTNTIKFKNHL